MTLPTGCDSPVSELVITLVRHGETVSNRQRKCQGWSEGCLTQLGQEQASRLRGILCREKYHQILCSDLLRVRQTADAALDDEHLAQVQLDSRLRERNGGIFEGGAYGAHTKAAKAAGVDPREFRAPGENAECWDDVKARAQVVIEELATRYLGSVPGALLRPTKSWGKGKSGTKAHVLIFCHGGFIKEVNNICLGARDHPNNAKNTSLWRYQLAIPKSDDQIVSVAPFSLVNATNHLKGIKQHLEGTTKAWEGQLRQDWPTSAAATATSNITCTQAISNDMSCITPTVLKPKELLHVDVLVDMASPGEGHGTPVEQIITTE